MEMLAFSWKSSFALPTPPAFVGIICLALGSGFVLLGSCELIGPSLPSGETTAGTHIAYLAGGGFGGGILQKLTIDEDALVTDELTTPDLHIQLADQEHRALLALFSSSFFSLKDYYDEGRCADDIYYRITYRQGDRSKTVSASGCTLFEAGGAELAMLARIVRELNRLARRMYEEEAPWLGLEADFYVKQNTYGLGEPITLLYRITNPTEKVRTLYFPYQERLTFRIHRHGFPAFNYAYVQEPEESELSMLVFQPGEEKMLQLVWDQTLTDGHGGAVTVEAGRYMLVLSLLDSSFLREEAGIPIEIVDRSVPLSGYVEGEGEDRSVSSYMFKLYVRNWTEAPVTLHFPYRQQVYVELYDLDKPQPGSLLFEGPKERQEEPTALTLQPGETHVFEYTVPKEKLNLTYLWYFARVKLLASNVAFSRESQLRIAW